MDDRERRDRRAIIEVAASGLKQAADEEDLEKNICILQILECGTSLDKFDCKAFKVVCGNRFEVFEKLISEDYRVARVGNFET